MIDMLLDGVRTIFAFIDKMVVFVIEYLYQLIIAIADTNVFGNLIYRFLGRIYVFLGIFMVFKLSISMINYVINPDAFTDKGKGVGKLVGNVIISLVLLVVTPNLFKTAFDLQEDILKSNAVYQIVTGKKLENTGDTLYTNAQDTGSDIAYQVFSAFVYKKSDSDNTITPPLCDTSDASKNDYDCSGTCSQENGIDCLLASKTVTNDSNTYWWLLSTVVGLVVAYILLTFCFDIAIRSVKLGFLQIVAPIPIMLRMDPTAKDDKFSKWLKEVGGTFLSLFIRLAGLFFVIEIIRLVMNPDPALKMFTTYSGYAQEGLLFTFVKLFIIIGCLMFAKKLPQLISDLFGIKLDGDGFSLKKKLGAVPGAGLVKGAGKMLGAGALGFAGGMAANALAARKNFSWDKGQGFWKNMGNNALGLGKSAGSMAAGGLSGLGRGAFSKEKSLWKAGGAGAKGAIGARNARSDRIASGQSWFGAQIGKVSKAAGIATDDTSKLQADFDLGESMYKNALGADGKIDDAKRYAEYKNADFAAAARNADITKKIRDDAQSDYEIARMKYERGEAGITAEQVNTLRVDAAKASATYDKAKTELSNQKTLHSDDARKYDAFSAAEDRHKVKNAAES